MVFHVSLRLCSVFSIPSFPGCINFIDWASVSLNSFLSAHISCWVVGWNFHLFCFLNPEFPFVFKYFLHLYLKLSIWWDFPVSVWKWFPMVLWSHIIIALKSMSAKLNTGELFFLNFYFTLFCFRILYWFCHTLTWIHHGCTWVPNPEPPPTFHSISSLWTFPVHQPQASCILYWT